MDAQYQSHGVLVSAVTEDPEVALILVVGESQSGKTKLVNLLSRSNLPTGHGAASCTHHIQLSRPFELDGQKVILIDTPGLEHSYREESVIFRELVLFLVDVYKKEKRLHGVIYVQSIMDNWKSATAVRCITLIKEMCGENAMKNVTIASTARQCLGDEARAKREAQMVGAEWSLQPFLEAGATFISHKNLESARQILVHILDNDPRPLLVQVEMQDQKKKLHETGLGSALAFGTEEEVLYNHEKYMKELITDMGKLRMDLTSHYLGWNTTGYPNGHYNHHQGYPMAHYNHHQGYPMARLGGLGHSTMCNICGEGIYGVRYKCIQCPGYDACLNCYYYIPEMHPMHSFVRVSGLEAAAYRTAPASYAPSQFASCCGALAAPVRQSPYTQCTPAPPHISPTLASAALSHGTKVSVSPHRCDTSASLV